MPRIEGLQGMQYIRDGTDAEKRDYAFFNQQYASSSEGVVPSSVGPVDAELWVAPQSLPALLSGAVPTAGDAPVLEPRRQPASNALTEMVDYVLRWVGLR